MEYPECRWAEYLEEASKAAPEKEIHQSQSVVELVETGRVV
jgi:hypothetical protein